MSIENPEVKEKQQNPENKEKQQKLDEARYLDYDPNSVEKKEITGKLNFYNLKLIWDEDSKKQWIPSLKDKINIAKNEPDIEKKKYDLAMLYVQIDRYQKEIDWIKRAPNPPHLLWNLDLICTDLKNKIMWEVQYEEKFNAMLSELFGKISNNDFLKYTAKDQRLEKITKPPKEAKDVKSGDDIRFTFTFENKLNENLYLKTTAGQVLPSEVREVELDWVNYFRNSIWWEFFTTNNERLTIHEWTQIKIWKIWTPEEMIKMLKENELKVAEYLKQNTEVNSKIVSESINRWIDPKFAVMTFSDLIKWKTDENEIDVILEDAFTEFDRIRWQVESSWKMEIVKEWQQWRYDENLVINLLKVLFPWLWKEKAISNWFSEKEIDNFESVSNTKIDFSALNWDTNKMISETWKELWINEKLIKSILMQESSWNMAATRFEKHVYDRELKKWNSPETAKLLATSFWWFQIMGFNYETCWYKSVQEFVDAMKNPEEQFNSFANFVKSKWSLYNAMKKEPPDFQTIAYNYNWPGYAQNNYDRMIEKRFYA